MYKLILSIAFFFFSLTSFAQSEEEGDDKKKKKCDSFLELVVALNLSGVGGESESYNGSLPGIYLGLGLDILCMSDELRLRTEPAFSMQGSKYGSSQYEPGGGGSTDDKATLRMNYLVLPLTARYQNRNGFLAEAGVQPGLLLSVKDKNNGNTGDARDNFNSFDVGLIIGAGYRPPKSKIGFGVRFAPGLTNINKESGSYEGKDRNRNATFRLSYSL